MDAIPYAQDAHAAEILTEFSEGYYLTYPHSNGFWDSGRRMIVGQKLETIIALWEMDLSGGSRRKVVVKPYEPDDPVVLWFDVALEAGILVHFADGAVQTVDLHGADGSTMLSRGASTASMELVMVSITPDANQVLFSCGKPEQREAWLIDTLSGEASQILSKSWCANHFHFSPFNAEWIGFCHEGPTETIPDRVWAWHAHKAPQGRRLFDNGARGLCVGHERWAFHNESVIAVAYGLSPSGPRGLYQLFTDGTEAKLLSEGQRDWHVDISRDGRWAVVDTTGPFDAPGRGWEGANGVSDIILIDVTTGVRTPLARTHYHASHPCHPHPIFTPDGRWILFNDSHADGRTRIAKIPNPCLI